MSICASSHLSRITPADGDKGSPFIWLQSLEDGALAFLVMEPHQSFPDYAPRVPRGEMEELGLN